MFPRVVQCGDGSDETRTRKSTGSDDSEAGDDIPAPRHPSSTPSNSERLPAPLQYRDPARYDIVAEHGRGGLGRVFRARDKELGRDVALKELLSRGSTTELRFFREALITARLEHPGIVPVHEAGRWPDGTPFYAMKLVAGRPLKALIDDCKTLEDRLALLPHVIAVADAIAYAHDRKIIHRDLKPSNIIVGDFGETVVIDWGLAKDISDQAPADDPIEDGPYRTAATAAAAGDGVTVAGSILGTPAYMSPEQARGDLVDERTDVYAIGAILRELANGDVARGQAHERNSQQKPRISSDLVAILDAATAAAPDERYRNARELARDLRAFQSGARIHARRYTLVDLIGHWWGKHRRAVTLVGVLLSITAGFATWSLIRVLGERDRARTALAAAETAELTERRAREESEHSRDQARLSEATLLLETDPTRALDALQETKTSTQKSMLHSRVLGAGTADLRVSFGPTLVTEFYPGADWRTLILRTSDRRLHLVDLTSGTRRIVATRLLEPSPIVPFGDSWIYANETDRKPYLTSLSGRFRPISLDHLPRWPTFGVAVRDDVLLLDKTGNLYSTTSGTPELIRADVAGISSSDGGRPLVCTTSGRLQRLGGPAGLLGQCVHHRHAFGMATSGNMYVAARNSHQLVVDAGKGQHFFDVKLGNEYQLAMSSSSLVAVVASDGTSWLVKPDDDKATPGPTSDAVATSVTADGTFAAWGYADGSVRVVDVETGSQWTFVGHTAPVTQVFLRVRDGQLLSVGGSELRRWKLAPALALAHLPLPCDPFNIAIGAIPPKAAVDCIDGNTRLVEPFALKSVSLHTHHALAFSPAWIGNRVCSGGWDGRLLCTNTETLETETVASYATPIRWVESAPDRSRIAYLVGDGSVWSYDGTNKQMLYRHAAEAYRVVFSPDGKSIASGDYAGGLRVYDFGTRTLRESQLHTDLIFSLEWTNAGLWTTSTDHFLRRWADGLTALETVDAGVPIREFASSDNGWIASEGETLWIRSHGRDYRFPLGTRIADLSRSPSGRYAVVGRPEELLVFDLREFSVAAVKLPKLDVLCARFVTDETFGLCVTRGLLWGSIRRLSFTPLTTNP